MTRFNIIHQSHETIQAREKTHGEWIEYSALITIKDGGKNPITIEMTFDSIPPFAIEFNLPQRADAFLYCLKNSKQLFY